MHKEQNTAAGNEAVRNIKHGERDKFRFDHIDHITQPHTVNDIAQTAAVNGCDAPTLQGSKGQRFFKVVIDNQYGQHDKKQNCTKEHPKL